MHAICGRQRLIYHWITVLLAACRGTCLGPRQHINGCRNAAAENTEMSESPEARLSNCNVTVTNRRLRYEMSLCAFLHDVFAYIMKSRIVEVKFLALHCRL
jgi:hypothetical protein